MKSTTNPDVLDSARMLAARPDPIKFPTDAELYAASRALALALTRASASLEEFAKALEKADFYARNTTPPGETPDESADLEKS